MSTFPPASQVPPPGFPLWNLPQEKPSNGLAIGAIVCGGIGLLFPPLALVGLILGIVALTGRRASRGVAIAGVVVSACGMFIGMMCLIGIMLPALGKARQTARMVASQSNMRSIAAALNQYASANKGAYPEAGADWQARLAPYGISTTQLMARDAQPGQQSYFYITPEVDGGKQIILYENLAFRLPDNQISVAFSDGSVDAVDKNDLKGWIGEAAAQSGTTEDEAKRNERELEPASAEFGAALETLALAAGDSAKFDAAQEAFEKFLEGHPPNAAERTLVYERAASMKATDENAWNDAGGWLVGSVSKSVTERDIAAIDSVFARLNRHAKVAALANIATLDTHDATDAYVRLANLAANTRELDDLTLGALGKNPLLRPRMLAGLLNLVELDNDASCAVLELALEILDDDALPIATRQPLAEASLAAHGRMMLILRELEIVEKPDEAQLLRLLRAAYTEGVILDILGRIPIAGSSEAARDALTLRRSAVRAWAAIALLSLKQPLSEEELESVAAPLESREEFTRALQRHGLLDRLPEKFRNNESFAMACMVGWLGHPLELGEPPEKIELVQRVELEKPQGVRLEHYVFKFLPRKSESEPNPKWQVGWSGPYKAGMLDLEGGEGTFSDAAEWDASDAAELITHIRKRIEELRDPRNK